VTTAEVLMLEKESPRCKPRGPELSCQGRNQHGATQKGSRKLSLCGTHPETLTRRDLLKQERRSPPEEVAAYNPYLLHKAQPGLYILKVYNVFRLFGDI